MVPRVRQTRHYEMFEWRCCPLPARTVNPQHPWQVVPMAFSWICSLLPRGLFLLKFVWMGNLSVNLAYCAHCLWFSQTAALWFVFLIIYFQYAIDSCDNRKHAVLSLNSAAMLYIPEWKCSQWCVVSLWVKKCQFQIWVLDFFSPGLYFPKHML